MHRKASGRKLTTYQKHNIYKDFRFRETRNSTKEKSMMKLMGISHGSGNMA